MLSRASKTTSTSSCARLVEDGHQALLDGLDDLDVPAVRLVVPLRSGAGAVYLLLQG